MQGFGAGLLGLALFVFLMILAVMALLMPIAVWRIRREIIELNARVKRIVEIMPVDPSR